MPTVSLPFAHSSFTPWRSNSVAAINHQWCVMNRVERVRLKAKREVRAFFFNPIEEPIVKEALKEPVAFMGGVFAGLLRLDLNDDPLKEWLNRTVEAAGITEEEVGDEESKAEEDAPQQIDIE